MLCTPDHQWTLRRLNADRMRRAREDAKVRKSLHLAQSGRCPCPDCPYQTVDWRHDERWARGTGDRKKECVILHERGDHGKPLFLLHKRCVYLMFQIHHVTSQAAAGVRIAGRVEALRA